MPTICQTGGEQGQVVVLHNLHFDLFGSFSVKIQLLSFTWIIGKLPEGAIKIIARGSVVFFFRMGCVYHCIASVVFLVGCFVFAMAL